MACFVFSGASCQCSLGGTGVVNAMSPHVRNGMAGMLTETDFPLMTGVCPVPPPTGSPCVYQPGLWTGVSPKVKCLGKRALLSDSVCNCMKGGAIRFTGAFSKVRNTGGVSVSEAVGAETDKPAPQISASGQSIERPSASALTGTPFALSVGTPSASAQVSGTPSALSAETPSASEGFTRTPPATRELSETPRERRWCSGDCPPEYRTRCPFQETPDNELTYPNDSGKLAKNMQLAAPELYEAAVRDIREIVFLSGNGVERCSIAHHHLIPGNQCLSARMSDGSHAYPLLLRLCNFYGYDVNRAENGILLPTVKGNALSGQEKMELYYFIMDEATKKTRRSGGFSGAQLHVGQHTYESPREVLGKLRPEVRLYNTYEYLVRVQLQRLENKFRDRAETVCHMRDLEANGKRRFLTRMDGISNTMRENILLFPREAGDRSWRKNRAYVSFPALAYDFGVAWQEYALCFYSEEG